MVRTRGVAAHLGRAREIPRWCAKVKLQVAVNIELATFFQGCRGQGRGRVVSLVMTDSNGPSPHRAAKCLTPAAILT